MKLDPQDIESIAKKVVELLRKEQAHRVEPKWSEDESETSASMVPASLEENGGLQSVEMGLKILNRLEAKARRLKQNDKS